MKQGTLFYVTTKRLKITYFYLCCSFIICTSLSAQELPPIENFTTQQYNADNQNWGIAQTPDKTIYVANNKGLLTYNGAEWRLYENKNQTVIRSVAVANQRVYTGSYMDFGYWEADTFGMLQYTSLVKELQTPLLQDEEFWTIIPLGEWIVFQSLERIFIYNTSQQSFKIISSDYRITCIANVNGTIYFQKRYDGLYKIENGEAVLVSRAAIASQQELINIFHTDGALLLHTRDDGFYILNDYGIKKWNIPANTLLNSVSAYSSIRLRNGNFIIGTISDGLIKIDKAGNVLFEMNQEKGLLNNTVLSAFQDLSGNIWLALDNGISVLNLDSPYRVYKDTKGKLGTIYTSVKTDTYLYLGTNQGLFYRALNSKGDFTLVPNTQGQVWTLKELDGELFCGHDRGTFIIDGTTATPIVSEKGTWDIKAIEGYPNVLLQGSYKGLAVLKKNARNQWEYSHDIQGFDISSRYFEFISPHKLLISHEYRGVYQVELDAQFKTVTSYTKDSIAKGINSSLFRYQNAIHYAYNSGIYRYGNKGFVKDSVLSSLFLNDSYVSGRLINDVDNNKLWAFFKDQMLYVQPGSLTATPSIHTIDLPHTLRKSKSGYENILHLKENTYLLGTTEGYLVINLDKFKSTDYHVSIDNVFYSTSNSYSHQVQINKASRLQNYQNNIHITFSVPDYSSLHPSFYQYRFEGLSNDWSDWSEASSVFFENLPYGNFTFMVRAKVGNNVSKNTATFSFTIAKPWYISSLAIVIYILGFLLLTLGIQYINKRYYAKQQSRLLAEKKREIEFKEIENKRQLTEFKNKHLQQDIENKNRELSVSTMNLIRKNELLNTLKSELTKVKTMTELPAVVRIIDNTINNQEEWERFEQAFNNVDKDFIKKIKQKHPSLTPNDLKLCTYLRLNLSSKEIAPLLNISSRSVEVKRYRLRKKMNLTHNASLTNYIFEI